MTSTSRQTPTGAALACCAAILLATLTRPLLAEDLTFRFTTTVDASSVGGPANAPLVATYTFASDLQNGTGSFLTTDSLGSYGPIYMTLQVGDQRLTATGDILVGNNGGVGKQDIYDVRFYGASYGGPVPGQLFGLDVEFFLFQLTDSDGTMFNSTAMPLSPDFARKPTSRASICNCSTRRQEGTGSWPSTNFPTRHPRTKRLSR